MAVDVNSSNSYGYELAALQGIVARTQPKLFLVNRPDDLFWLDYAVSKYGLSYQNSTSVQALQMFKSYVSDSAGRVRVIVYDSNDPIFPLKSISLGLSQESMTPCLFFERSSRNSG